MAKKKKLVVGVDLQRRPRPNRLIAHPHTGTVCFADFPEISVPGKAFAAGPIYLREGEHVGRHRGHGFMHIWAERFNAYTDQTAAEKAVAELVASILVTGSAIHHAGGITPQEQDRATIWHNAHGTVIIEERGDVRRNTVFYSVVTAIPGGQPHGAIIGRLPR